MASVSWTVPLPDDRTKVVTRYFNTPEDAEWWVENLRAVDGTCACWVDT